MKNTVFKIENWYLQLVVNVSFVIKFHLFSEVLGCGNSAAIDHNIPYPKMASSAFTKNVFLEVKCDYI